MFKKIAASVASIGSFLQDEQPQVQVLTAHDYKFMEYVTKHGKTYGTVEEFNYRLENFKKKLTMIEKHNAIGTQSYTLGLNHMSDWSDQEYNKLVPELHPDFSNIPKVSEEELMKAEVPNGGWDWRQEGLVTGIKNQGQCGSCWAFSTTGVIEGHMKKQYGQLVPLSEQQILDCSSGSCGGYPVAYAIDYVKANPLNAENQYPYTMQKGQCRRDPASNYGMVQSYATLPQTDDAMVQGLMQYGPISVQIYASPEMQLYQGGIWNNCGSGAINHAVLVVGYNDNYWIVKNQWGTQWGEQGYMRMQKGAYGCHVNEYPIVITS